MRTFAVQLCSCTAAPHSATTLPNQITKILCHTGLCGHMYCNADGCQQLRFNSIEPQGEHATTATSSNGKQTTSVYRQRHRQTYSCLRKSKLCSPSAAFRHGQGRPTSSSGTPVVLAPWLLTGSCTWRSMWLQHTAPVPHHTWHSSWLLVVSLHSMPLSAALSLRPQLTSLTHVAAHCTQPTCP